jgi:hypothetical protein
MSNSSEDFITDFVDKYPFLQYILPQIEDQNGRNISGYVFLLRQVAWILSQIDKQKGFTATTFNSNELQELVVYQQVLIALENHEEKDPAKLTKLAEEKFDNILNQNSMLTKSNGSLKPVTVDFIKLMLDKIHNMSENVKTLNKGDKRVLSIILLTLITMKVGKTVGGGPKVRDSVTRIQVQDMLSQIDKVVDVAILFANSTLPKAVADDAERPTAFKAILKIFLELALTSAPENNTGAQLVELLTNCSDAILQVVDNTRYGHYTAQFTAAGPGVTADPDFVARYPSYTKFLVDLSVDKFYEKIANATTNQQVLSVNSFALVLHPIYVTATNGAAHTHAKSTLIVAEMNAATTLATYGGAMNTTINSQSNYYNQLNTDAGRQGDIQAILDVYANNTLKKTRDAIDNPLKDNVEAVFSVPSFELQNVFHGFLSCLYSNLTITSTAFVPTAAIPAGHTIPPVDTPTIKLLDDVIVLFKENVTTLYEYYLKIDNNLSYNLTVADAQLLGIFLKESKDAWNKDQSGFWKKMCVSLKSNSQFNLNSQCSSSSQNYEDLLKIFFPRASIALLPLLNAPLKQLSCKNHNKKDELKDISKFSNLKTYKNSLFGPTIKLNELYETDNYLLKNTIFTPTKNRIDIMSSLQNSYLGAHDDLDDNTSEESYFRYDKNNDIELVDRKQATVFKIRQFIGTSSNLCKIFGSNQDSGDKCNEIFNSCLGKGKDIEACRSSFKKINKPSEHKRAWTGLSESKKQLLAYKILKGLGIEMSYNFTSNKMTFKNQDIKSVLKLDNTDNSIVQKQIKYIEELKELVSNIDVQKENTTSMNLTPYNFNRQFGGTVDELQKKLITPDSNIQNMKIDSSVNNIKLIIANIEDQLIKVDQVLTQDQKALIKASLKKCSESADEIRLIENVIQTLLHIKQRTGNIPISEQTVQNYKDHLEEIKKKNNDRTNKIGTILLPQLMSMTRYNL